jgi:hypothetical protein
VCSWKKMKYWWYILSSFFSTLLDLFMKAIGWFAFVKYRKRPALSGYPHSKSKGRQPSSIWMTCLHLLQTTSLDKHQIHLHMLLHHWQMHTRFSATHHIPRHQGMHLSIFFICTDKKAYVSTYRSWYPFSEKEMAPHICSRQKERHSGCHE